MQHKNNIILFYKQNKNTIMLFILRCNDQMIQKKPGGYKVPELKIVI
jgi:hypothetical protein